MIKMQDIGSVSPSTFYNLPLILPENVQLGGGEVSGGQLEQQLVHLLVVLHRQSLLSLT